MSTPTADEVQTKYRAERDKRLRRDGNEQYVEVVGDFARFVDDPWAEAPDREPVTDHVVFTFIGGGFAGLLAAVRVREAGIDSVRVVEKGGDFGGTWYWNRYPGAQCDTTSFVYMPLLEETGHMPTEKYAHGPEILEHSRRIASHFDLYDNALLSTEVTELRWQEESAAWLITTNRGDRFTSKFVGMGTGPLHRPKLPGIPGVGSFGGHAFHTSRWDYEYTGGSPTDPTLAGLSDKRVGIIGTGATSVQCIPHLAKHAGELFVFQRTPSSIDIRNNAPVDPEWFATLDDGWQQKWLDNFTALQTGGFVDEDLVKDGWTDISKRIRDRVLAGGNNDFSPEALRQAYEDSDDEKMAEIRARVDDIVADPDTAESLKPWYRQLCKRPCFHDDYLHAYNESGVTLVDTDGQGVQEITERGVVVAGTHYDLDCLIYATGFEVGTSYDRRSGFDTIGRNGALSDRWAEGMRSLHGVHVHGFPNLFIASPSQGANLISNVPHNLVERAKTIAAIVGHAQKIGARTVDATHQAESDWMTLLESEPRTFGNDPECTPGYYNNEGQPVGREGLIGSLGYPAGPVAYFDYITTWREAGDFSGLDFVTQ